MLLAVGLALGLIGARSILAFKKYWRLGVFVINMAVSLRLIWPTDLEVLAVTLRALPWARMSFLMFPIVDQYWLSPEATS